VQAWTIFETAARLAHARYLASHSF